jgi:hypothetical protein
MKQAGRLNALSHRLTHLLDHSGRTRRAPLGQILIKGARWQRIRRLAAIRRNIPSILEKTFSVAANSPPGSREACWADLPRDRNWGASINRAAGGDRPELLDAVVADGDIPVVEVDGRVAVAGDEADLVAEPEAVGGARDAEAAVLVGGALVGGGGLVADERRA